MSTQPVASGLARQRRWLRGFARMVQAAFLHVQVSGLEHVPPDGPLLVLFNHLSSLDGPLVMANFPHELELVGPGDFTLAFPGPLVVKAYGMTLIKRGQADRTSLKVIIAHLRAGRRLAMAPEGGTWEKGLADVKPGAAYVSQLTQTPILPVGVGGAYQVEDRLLTRPRLTVRFGELMPPVPASQDRRMREADLEAASREIMARLYDLLPPEDQARYDQWGRAAYTLRLDFQTDDGTPLAYDGPPLPDLGALAEFLGKPNLFRPVWQNARLPVEPLRERRFFFPLEVQISLRMVEDLLTAGDYAEYLAYRLGDEQAQAALDGLRAVRGACDWALRHHARVRLEPVAAMTAGVPAGQPD
ncbi:MAG: 1-acyl-sn-glycerol-3-phosphate acyltransferase [Anaerolineae bacterium]|nr:1-acyl-sn-glycerol-3-phosphate acyltransferase [Anaerolineae bacterium]